MKNFKPSKEHLRDAVNRTTEDLIDYNLKVLFVGINPGLWSGATGFHFARPGNRFWRALHEAGLTPHVVEPANQHELLNFGIGVVNLVSRTTAAAAELGNDELRAGA